MATFMVTPGIIGHEPVYGSTAPIHCASCHAPHDEDDDLGLTYDLVDGDPYCTANFGASCFTAARDAAYRAEVTELLTELLTRAIKQMDKIDTRYAGACEDENGPYGMIDDCLTRVRLFSEGKDTGFRTGVMLSSDEAFDLSRLLERAIFDKQYDLKQQLEKRTCLGIYASSHDARLLGSFGKQSLMLTQAIQRTEKGCAA